MPSEGGGGDQCAFGATSTSLPTPHLRLYSRHLWKLTFIFARLWIPCLFTVNAIQRLRICYEVRRCRSTPAPGEISRSQSSRLLAQPAYRPNWSTTTNLAQGLSAKKNLKCSMLITNLILTHLNKAKNGLKFLKVYYLRKKYHLVVNFLELKTLSLSQFFIKIEIPKLYLQHFLQQVEFLQ